MRSLLNGMGVKHEVSRNNGEVGATVTVGPVEVTFAFRGGASHEARGSSLRLKAAEAVLPAAPPDPDPSPEPEEEWSPPVYEFWIEDGQDYCAQW